MPAAPFSSRARGLAVGTLPDGFGYGFDFSDPAGVKLIPPEILPEIAAAVPTGASLRSRFPELFHNPRNARPERRLSVWLHVVNVCNFACHYCYVPHLRRMVDPQAVTGRSIPEDQLDPLLANLLGYCRAQGLAELHVTFAGGEPTLNLPLIEKFCDRARAIDTPVLITFGMISNGSFDAGALVPLLQRHRIALSLSIDGFGASHDRIRFTREEGRKVGSWDGLMGNVERLREADLKPFFLYTITPGNFRDLPRFAAYVHARDLGFRLSLVRARQPVARDVREEIAAEIIRLYAGLAETLDPRLPIPRHAAFAEWDLYRRKYTACSSCRNYFAIDAQGGVATCQMRMNETYGNAAAEPFAAIVSRVQAAPAAGILARPEARGGTCTTCEFFHVCGGGCPQHTALALGHMDQPSPWCQVFGAVIPHYVRAVARQLQRAVQSVPA